MKILDDNNIKYWDIRKQNIETLSISAWNSNIKSFENSIKTGHSVRILYKNGWGFASAFDDNVKKSIKKAIKIAKLMNDNSKEEKNIVPYSAIKDEKNSPFKINNDDISLEEKKKIVLNNSKKQHDLVKNCQTNYSETMKSLSYVNSEGSDIKQNLRYTFSNVSVTSKKGDRTENFMDRIGEQAGYEVTKKFPELVMNATKKSIDMLDSVVPKSGLKSVICDGALTDVFVHEALGHAAEADQILQNSSCLKGLVGKQIAPEFISIYDDATMKGLWGTFFYDDEGVKAQKTTLVENGILKGFMHSRETAAALNGKPSGNARAQSVSYVPQVRMSNTYIKKNKSNFDDMLAEAKNGVYLKGSVGGQVDPTTGNFTFSAQEGFEIVKGELGKRLRGVSLSGNTLETLKNISLISNKYEESFAGFCGKGGQYVPVYGPCPKVLIKKSMVGGQ